MLQKRLILLLLILVIFANNSSALDQLDITLPKYDYSGGETMLIELYFNEMPVRSLNPQDIKLSQGSIAPTIIKDTDKHYYIFFNVPMLDNGYYNININLLYNINNVLSNLNFKREFTIDNAAQSLSISPAAIRIDATKIHNYQIYLKNNGISDVDISLSEDISYVSLSKSQISMDAESQKSFFITINKNEIISNKTTFVKLSYGNNEFSLPLIVYNFKEKTNLALPIEPSANVTQEITNTINESYQNKTENKTFFNQTNNITYANIVEIQPLVFIANDTVKIQGLIQNKSRKGMLLLKNNLEKPLIGIRFNITGSLSEIAKLNYTYIDVLAANKTITQYIFINPKLNAKPGVYAGTILANSIEGYSDSVYFELYFEQDTSKINIIERAKNTINKAVGRKDEPDEETGLLDFTGEKTTIKPAPKQEKTNKIVLLALLITVALLIFLFYKLMTRKKQVSFDEYVDSLKR